MYLKGKTEVKEKNKLKSNKLKLMLKTIFTAVILILILILVQINALAFTITGDDITYIKEGEKKEIKFTAPKGYYLQISEVKSENDNVEIVSKKTNKDNPKEVTLEILGKKEGLSEVVMKMLYADTTTIEDKVNSKIRYLSVVIQTKNEDSNKNTNQTSIENNENKSKENEEVVKQGNILDEGQSREIKQDIAKTDNDKTNQNDGNNKESKENNDNNNDKKEIVDDFKKETKKINDKIKYIVLTIIFLIIIIGSILLKKKLKFINKKEKIKEQKKDKNKGIIEKNNNKINIKNKDKK